MMPSEPVLAKHPPFYLGLCMAGAISAGAYTAGVVDYLVEALDRWEQARETRDPRVPTHRVVLDSMTGASAGGMTAAIAAASLHDHLDPVNAAMGGYRHFVGKNKLYKAWVNLIQDEMLPLMLRTDDLAEFGAASVLNSDFIDQIAQEMLQVKEPCPARAYVAPDLEVCVSLSNLTGFQEVIEFDNASKRRPQPTSGGQETEGRYVSVNHRDFGHFVVGEHYQHDGRIPVRFGDELNEGLHILRDCAMATGAFPVGLRWRSVRRKGKYLNDNPLINSQITQFDPVTGTLPGSVGASDHPKSHLPIQGISNNRIYASVNVDGGLLNNEPFEIAQQIMVRRMAGRQPAATQETVKALVRPVSGNAQFSILMIEPFPTVENAPQIQPRQRILLKTIIGQIYATMRSQLRFKQQDLQKGVNKEESSRYIIAPTRTADIQKIIGSRAIACGSLGGFGGFLTKAYRAHDFQLGRRNCQWFLQKHFRVEADTENEIFRVGYHHEKAKQAFGFMERGKWYLPVIPDIDPGLLGLGPNHLPQTVEKLHPPEEQKPDYPALPENELRRLISSNRPALKTRLFSILSANGIFSDLYVGLLVRLLKSPIMETVAKQIEEMVIEDLYDHKLVKKPLL